MRVLVACEYSGVVRDAFLKRGHDAISCDLLPSDKPGPHYQGDVFDIIDDGWDLLIAHPPCTFLCNSGVRWLYHKGTQDRVEQRWREMKKGAQFFKRLLKANIKKKCVENPIQHRYAQEIIKRRHTQVVQPWMFGHPEQKATCLWLEELPPLIATNVVKDIMMTLSKAERERECFTYHLPKIVGRSVVQPTRALRMPWLNSGAEHGNS